MSNRRMLTRILGSVNLRVRRLKVGYFANYEKNDNHYRPEPPGCRDADRRNAYELALLVGSEG